VNNKSLLLGTVLAFGLSASSSYAATTITINNTNTAGVGFNDTTAAAPVGGNTGTTLGAQRLIVFQQAADQWAVLLNSNVPIVVDASMTSLTCNGTSATLGSAGANALLAGVPGGRSATTAYTLAEGNALAGSNQLPGTDDITANFNVDIDNGTCLTGTTGWWYGIDPSVTPPGTTIPLLPVVFHELGHGLGFSSATSSSTGAYFSAPDVPVWANYLYDTGTSQLWKNMNNAQRKTSATNDPHLVWTGPRTNKQAGGYLRAGNALIINTPAALAGPNPVGTADFGGVVPPSGITGNLVLVNDGSGTVTDACQAITNNVSGSIALIDRGTCNFTVKVKNAQVAGAIAAIIADNAAPTFLGEPPGLGGSDPTVTISSYAITQALGASLKANLPANVTLGYANIGVNQGCVRMFAPNPVISGSSVSHFHVDATPDLLMEPALNTTIFNHTDLTLPLFADIDWSTNNLDDFIFFDGFDANPCQDVQP
jgi:hypothetical protein